MNVFFYFHTVIFLILFLWFHTTGTTRLDALAAQYLIEVNPHTFRCRVCGWIHKHRFAAKLHIESKHFPTESGYSCDLCYKLFNTFSALKSHNHSYHPSVNHSYWLIYFRMYLWIKISMFYKCYFYSSPNCFFFC